MRALHIVTPAEFGGLERVVELLATGQRRRGRDVHVAAVINDPAAGRCFADPLVAAGVAVHRLELPARAYARERGEIARLCRELAPDVVHTHGYRPDILDAGVARGLGIPVVTTVHGFTGGGPKLRIYEWMQVRAFRRFEAVVAVARGLGEALRRRGVPAGRVHVVPNAWAETTPPLSRTAARWQLALQEDRFHLGWVGRLSREKGGDVLIDALEDLRDLPCLMSVLGAGRDQATLQARAAARGLGDRVRWHGIVPNAGRLFTAFDVFVLSSRTEGTPVVLFEAMAAGVPIVATAVGGVPDMLAPHEAWLMPSENPAALAAAIRAVFRDPAKAAARATAARLRLARDFALEPWLERYDAIYRLAIAARETRAQAGVER